MALLISINGLPCRKLLVLLMFIGACAGSTGGGFKVSRLIILCKTARKELTLCLHPNAVKKVKMDGKAIPHEVVRTTNIFLFVYVLVFGLSVLLISIDNFDLTTNFTAVAATFNNIGPGLEMVGPTQNFGLFSHFSKCVLIFDMLAGRLEIFPLLILFKKDTWKKFWLACTTCRNLPNDNTQKEWLRWWCDKKIFSWF